MENLQGRLIVYQGEQFTRLIGGIEWDLCQQIVLCLYKGEIKKYFVKAPDEAKYPDAMQLSKSDSAEYQISCFIPAALTAQLPAGVYKMEAMRVIDGINAPILKSEYEFFTIKESNT
jgi:hypothetical protein